MTKQATQQSTEAKLVVSGLSVDREESQLSVLTKHSGMCSVPDSCEQGRTFNPALRRETQFAESTNHSQKVGLNATASLAPQVTYHQVKVFVLDSEGTPLLPTCPARARLLLKHQKATVYSVIPFTIRLNRKVENPVGSFIIGIDDGAKFAGISIAHEDQVVCAANVRLRQDTSRKMSQRVAYRSTRRSRLRHRKQRNLNRGHKGFLPPTIHQKKQAILRVIDDLKKRLNITACVVEQGMFDTSSLAKGYQLTSKEYQQSEFEGNNRRQKILWRDHYTCQHCKTKDLALQLQAHHILPRAQGGTNALTNGITLCKQCHHDLHQGLWSLPKNYKAKCLMYPAHLQQGKWYLYNELKKRFKEVQVIFGWMTYRKRIQLGLPKDHHYDASAMIGANQYHCTPYLVIFKRVLERNANKPLNDKAIKYGFKHYDIIKASHRTRGSVIGSIRSLCTKTIQLRTSFDSNFPVRYKKSKLLWRPRNLVYC